MAPVPPVLAFIDAGFNNSPDPNPEITALALSSLELDKRSTEVSSTSLQPREDGSTTLSPTPTSTPASGTASLFARDDTSTYIPGQGTLPPQTFNNHIYFALFAILGAAMSITAIWFFFWAKNGGFKFQEGDWDDYKSTVLRRKGPDGKTLSNATKSTKLGGSTIAGTQHYKWQKQAAKSIVGRDEKGRKGVLGKRGWAKTHSITYSDDYLTESFGTETVSDMTELRTEPDYNHHSKRYRDRDVQQYKKEKPARVGGLNRVADGSHFDPSTVAGSDTMTESSEQPILNKSKPRTKEREAERAERKARDEAARMERRWKRDAEEAAAALARENATRPPPPPTHNHHKSAAPASKPSGHKQQSQQRRESRSASPKKRDFSYQKDDPASEVLSTAYTGASSGGTRVSSYYDEYRPRASENPRYSSDHGGRSRQASPTKKSTPRPQQGGGRAGGYRRGADSDFD